jgi:hypothetical protein
VKPFVRALLRGALRAHPAAWRDRYGDELEALIADADPRPSDVIDLAASAVRTRLASLFPGGSPMTPSTSPWRGRALSMVALLLAGWTGLFLGLNVLRYNVGIAVPDFLAWTYATESPIRATLGVLGPAVIGLALALAAMAQITRHRTDGASAFLVRVRPTRLAVVASIACISVMVVIFAYGVSENLLESLR